jgi:hypothetical protein
MLLTKVFIQVFGIPIGLPGSPGYSMAICIFSEWKFSQSVYDYQKLFGLSRYFDDLRALVVYKRGCKKSKSTAELIINQ